MRRIGIVVSAVLLAACESGSEPSGVAVINHGIVAGNHQVQRAGETSYQAAVVEKIAREFKTARARPAVRVPWLQALLPRLAHAQGVPVTVNGSPVVGAVVCTDPDAALKPFVGCTNTGADGQALFFFKPPNIVGCYEAEIRGTVDNLPTVFDTARACVTPGPASTAFVADGDARNFGPVAVFNLAGVPDDFGNGIPYRIVSDGRLQVLGTDVGSEAARSVNVDPALKDDTNRWLEVRDGAGTLVAMVRYRVDQRASDGAYFMRWTMYGLGRPEIP